MNCIILHIPHYSKIIPDEFLDYFHLSQNELEKEINLMTDHFTDELFSINSANIFTILFPISRLLVDPERFELDRDEPMSKVGMGCLYELTSNGEQLKEVKSIRNKLINEFYKPHHQDFNRLVTSKLIEYEKVIIIDCHSFPKKRLPYEMSEIRNRPEICLGTDSFHTPIKLKDFLVEKFKSYGFSVDINSPFSGSIVPNLFYKTDERVKSIMIEIRRDKYMDENTYRKNKSFLKIRNTLRTIIKSISDKDF